MRNVEGVWAILIMACAASCAQSSPAGPGSLVGSSTGVASTAETSAASPSSSGRTGSTSSTRGPTSEAQESTSSGVEESSSSGAEPPIPSTNPLLGIGQPELIVGGLGFGEGPAWSRERELLFFSDVTNRIVYVVDESRVLVYLESSGGADGLAIDGADRLYAAQIFDWTVSREEQPGTLVPLASEYEGNLLNAPNDLVVRSDGTVFFSDPTNTGHAPQGVAGVYKISPDGTVGLLDGSLAFPNGVALSSDEKTLYVADSASHEIWSMELLADGDVAGKALFATIAGEPDGLAVDAAENLYATDREGFHAYAPTGELWGVVGLEEAEGASTNLAFGGVDGRTLFVTTSRELWRIEVEVPGFL